MWPGLVFAMEVVNLLFGALEHDDVARLYRSRVIPSAIMQVGETYADQVGVTGVGVPIAAINNVEHRMSTHEVEAVPITNLHLSRTAELADVALLAKAANCGNVDTIAPRVRVRSRESDELRKTRDADMLSMSRLSGLEVEL